MTMTEPRKIVSLRLDLQTIQLLKPLPNRSEFVRSAIASALQAQQNAA